MDTKADKELPVKEDEKQNLIQVGGFTVDLSRIPAFTLGDKVLLKKKYGIELAKLGEITPEQEIQLTIHMLQKANPDITQAEVERMSLSTVSAVMAAAGDSTMKVDRPT